MKLQQLRFLLAVADSGLNVTVAAERLYTSQPGVSKQIKLLESELGVALFQRKGRSLVGITKAGKDVIERARKVMHQIDGIKAATAEHRLEEEQVLSIATTHTQARYVLPPVIAKFKQLHPQVRLNLHQGTSEQIAELIQRDEIDFAMASGSENQFSDLLLIPCFKWDRIVLVPKDHALAKIKNTLTLKELADHPLVTYVFSFGRESSLTRAFEMEQLRPNVVFTARDADVIKTYVRMGMGVGIVASMAFDEASENDLIAIDAANLFPRSTTWIGYQKNTVLRPFMSDFIRLVSPPAEVADFDSMIGANSQSELDRIARNFDIPVFAQTQT